MSSPSLQLIAPQKNPQARGKGGFVLPLVLVLLSVLILTGASVYVSSMDNLRSARGHLQNIQSYYQAKAGATYVIDELGEDIKSGAVSLDQPVVAVNYAPPTGYNFDPVLAVRQLGDDRAYMFEVTGRAGTARTTFEIIFRTPQSSPFGDFFSDDVMTISGGASITGSARGNKAIVNSGGSTITGDAMPGPGYSVSDPSNVTGDTTPATSTLAIPLIDPAEVAAAMASNDNGALSSTYYDSGAMNYRQSGGYYAFPPGTYYFTEFVTSGGAITEVTGPVTIYCSGKIVVSGGGFTNPSLSPDNLIIKSVAIGKEVTWSGTSDCHARVYAPQAAKTTISGGGTFTGSIITKGKLTASGGSTLVGAGSSFGSGGPAIIVSAWREVF